MKDKWFISDTHFFHANMLKFVDDKGHRIRPFSNLEEMHEYMVNQWNSVVRPEDFVYHLGDVTFQYHRSFNSLMHELNGHKRLIVGNHDKIIQLVKSGHFEKIELWKGFKEEDFTCTHIPLNLAHLRDGHFNVHGHLHQRFAADPHYINVCCETVDYKPVNIEWIKKEISRIKEQK